MTLSPGPTLTQTDILSLPRPSAPISNPSSTLAIWPVSTHSFSDKRTNRQFNLVRLDSHKTGWEGIKDTEVLKEGLDGLEVQWLDDQTICYLSPAKPDSSDLSPASQGQELSDEEWKGVKSEWVREMGSRRETVVWAMNVVTKEEYKMGQFPVAISNLKTLILPSSSSPQALLAFSSLVFPDGSIYTYNQQRLAHEQESKGSDIRVYDSTFVRHWDEWSPTHGEKNQVFVVRLSRNPKDFDEDDESEESEEEFEVVDEREGGRWSFEREQVVIDNVKGHQPKVISPMAGTKLECPVGPFGSSSDFSLSPTSLVIHSKDPHVPPSLHTRTNIYLFPLHPKSHSDSEPKLLSIGTQGASSNPRFSPGDGGKKLSWLEMREDGYEADRNRIIVYSIEEGKRIGLTEEWDSSPSGFEWTKDGKSLLTITEERGHVVLYSIDVEGKKEPKKLTDKHSVTTVEALEGGRVLVGMNSFTTPNELYLISSDDSKPTPLATVSRRLMKEKKLHEGEEFTFAGSEGKEVHGWILFPPSHHSVSNSTSKDDKKTFPMACTLHGGPQTAWTDGWSTRWNLQSYASKGYIVVAINRTGSTGFGQEFCDAIQNEWGGKPFRDLVAGVQYVKKAYPEIDGERMAALGASYGGFMANWIQGHNEAFGFKCLVCHDGVFSLSNTYYATEELYFPTREFGGAPWEVPENYEKWNPQNHIKNWKTPELVIHGSKDYRLVEAEGLGVFNSLQRLGIPSRLLIFPSENHWVLNPANSVQWHKEVFNWIGEWTNTKDECE